MPKTIEGKMGFKGSFLVILPDRMAFSVQFMDSFVQN